VGNRAEIFGRALSRSSCKTFSYFFYVRRCYLSSAYDLARALVPRPSTGKERFGVGLAPGPCLNVVLLASLLWLSLLATSDRRFHGSIVARAVRKKPYNCVSCLNTPHLWAWCSLCSVMFADLYVRLCSMGLETAIFKEGEPSAIHDLTINL